MGLMNDIKNQINKSGSNKKAFVYFKPGNKVRIRFLQEIDTGHKITFHDSFQEGVNVPCQEHYGRDCDYCGLENLRTRDLYCWSVWDYDSNEVKILMGPANNYSPIPNLVGLSETYGTIMDRDYVITKNGSQQNTSFTVAPMDRATFKNKAAKPFSEQKLLKVIDKAFPADVSDADEDEDEAPKKKRKNSKPADDDDDDDEDFEEAPKKSKKKPAPPEDDDDDDDEEDEPAPKKSSKKPAKDDWDDEDEDEDDGYEEMEPVELYKLCKKRKLDVEPRKSQKYYVKVLREADADDEDIPF